jgi:hypothetical protein
MVPKTLRRYAIDQSIAVAKDPSIDPVLKNKLIQQLNETAVGPSVYGRLVYRFIAIALGLVAILVVVLSFVLLLNKHVVDSAFYTLGSAAVGALGGVFAPHSDGAATPPPVPAATDSAGGQVLGGPGSAPAIEPPPGPASSAA